jgi:DNA-binding beta-propeller fold protein YncE
MPGVQKGLGIASLSVLVAALIGGCGWGSEEADRSESGRVLEAAEPASKPESAPRFRAFVALESEDRLAIVEGPPWRLVRKVPLPSGPHNVAADPAGRHAAVSSPPAGRVTILDSRGMVTARAAAGRGAHDVDFASPSRLWVSAEDSSRIVRLKVPSGRSAGSQPTSGPPHDVAVSPDGSELWVTLDGDSAVEVRSARTGALLARPTFGSAPHDVEIAPGGKRVWFSNWSSPSLTVASRPRRKQLGALIAGGEPHHFSFGSGALWASDNATGQLLQIDPRSRRIRGRVRVGPQPHHVAVAGSQVLVAVHGSGRLAVVSRRGRLLQRLALGAGPHGIDAVPLPEANAPGK